MDDIEILKGRLANQEAVILRLHAELASAKEELCICHRIPSKDWHSDRCPAKKK